MTQVVFCAIFYGRLGVSDQSNFREGKDMSEPTLFVGIDSRYANNPLKRVIEAVAFGAKPMEQLVKDGVEVDIAVTNSVAVALRMIKETERTSIIIACLLNREREAAMALASRYADRVTAVPVMGSGEELELVPFLYQLIARKAKEVGDAHPTA